MPQETTVATLLQQFEPEFTRAERQLAAALMKEYPVSGLASITTLAQNADVSTPTVARMVKKIGFSGFPAFQDALRAELSAMISDPIRKRNDLVSPAPDAHLLSRFADSALGNIQQTLSNIDSKEFDQAARLIAAMDRKLYISGGRITHALSDYLFTHLQVIRPAVTQLGTAPGVWPHYVLEMKPKDVLVLFDIRRYENTYLRLAELAHEREVDIILFTDQWGSPVGKLASHRFSCHVAAPSAWDSCGSLMFVCEALIAAVQELVWDESRQRMEELEAIFDSTMLFRKFV